MPVRLVLVWLGFASFVTWPALAHANLAQGRKSLVHGEYVHARKELEQAKGAEQLPAKLELARLEQLLGNYKAALPLTASLLSAPNAQVSKEAHILHGELLRQTGKYEDAVKLLKRAYDAHPDALALRHALALAYEEVGHRNEARILWNAFFDDFDARRIDTNNDAHMFYVAEAARYLESFKDASDSYQEAIHIRSTFHRAHIRLGYLFLQKYAPHDAAEDFASVLKINPKHPDALAGLAATKLETSYDLAAAGTYVKEALAINPRHIPALLIRAQIAIDRNEWKAARRYIDRALAINPNSVEARSYLATIYWLREDQKRYQEQRDFVLRTRPGYSQFFHTVMHSAEREHRYAEGISLGKEAISVNPRDFEAMQLTATGLLRLGKEEEGLSWMQKAWKGDQYNLRTLNTLDLFEKFIPREYEFMESKHFKIRYHKDEREALHAYVAPMLERAFDDMVERYKFTPKTPIVIELYQNPEHYSVRTVGLPNLGALGVCFGQVITAMSPTVGELNWAMVLWHELSHVFAIQMSNSRVPRWFTEGLSEYETIRARPEWRRENDADVWAAMQDNSLPSVAELNLAFMNPDSQAVVVAYHLSSVTIEYLVSAYGFAKVVQALALFKEGHETPEVIATITGKSVPQFDREFRSYLQRRLAPYHGTLHIPSLAGQDLDSLKKRAKREPKRAESQARLALRHFYQGDAEASEQSADRALSLQAANPLALYIKAELALQRRQPQAAQSFYERLIRAGHDGFDIRVRLAQLAKAKGDKRAVLGHLQSAKVLDPERAYPYEALAELYAELGNEESSLIELEHYVMLEQMSLSPIMKLVRGYFDKKNWQKVVTYGELGRRIAPTNAELQNHLGDAYLMTKRPQDALQAFDTLLVVKPQIRRPAIAHLGRAKALLLLGRKQEALAATNRALDLEPENREALRLAESL